MIWNFLDLSRVWECSRAFIFATLDLVHIYGLEYSWNFTQWWYLCHFECRWYRHCYSRVYIKICDIQDKGLECGKFSLEFSLIYPGSFFKSSWININNFVYILHRYISSHILSNKKVQFWKVFPFWNFTFCWKIEMLFTMTFFDTFQYWKE